MKNKKLSGGEELTSHVFRQEESRGELATMVILHDYPLLMVEYIGFRRYVASIQPCFNTVSRNTMKSDIIRIYNDEKVKCYQVLDKLIYRVAITTDMWTSSNTKKGYMAITTYFVDDSWTLRSCILRFVYAPAPHVAEILAQVLSETLMDWNIDRKLSTILLIIALRTMPCSIIFSTVTSKRFAARWKGTSYAMLCSYFEFNCERWLRNYWCN
ncbi:UNVERIFIED_CONTAM: Zinc finger BED domain-containing protein RICESLEEPER 2 [Sesamum angustifolium]|uniref:Zinc finger BED domain-containing protein RICESLEEPER 2 n=1 Tax=Sesamum angustifolium TaxID=2727405 RepID=A0AAW2LXG0_9LAMI